MTAMKKYLFLLVFTTVLFLSCGGQSSFPIKAGSATTVYLDGFDSEIARIAENARNTLNVFFQHLDMPEAGESNFYIKYAFRMQAGGDADVRTEQVWISGIAFQDGRFYGNVASTPIYLAHVQSGDRVSFYADSIADWMFTRNGRIVGGESIRYLLTQIPENERTDSQRRTLRMFD